MKQYLRALPPWLGSKRSIARQIMRVVKEEGYGQGAVVADAFMGGGGMALAAKALGYEVHGNDMSPISVALGRALIENGERRIHAEERDLCLTASFGRAKIPPPKELSLPDNCRRLLAGMVEAERNLSDEARPLLQLWIAKTALTMATWGMPTMAAGRREWDDLTPGQAQQLKRTGRPMTLAKRTCDQINNGIFDNGLPNSMRHGDAVEFLAEQEADVAYLDPPYPGVTGYEKTYVGVNRLLDPETDDRQSEWSAADGWLLLEKAFDAAEAIPLWVVSQGTGADPKRITEMMEERGREAYARSLQHRHMPALKAEHAEDGDELLIVGKTKKGRSR